MATVSVDQLCARFGKRVVFEDVTLRMDSGVYGLLGPNGAGKTTLMRALATVIQPDQGKIRMLGRSIAQRDGRTEVRRRLGYLPQTFGYYPGFTVREFVEYVAWLKEMPGAEIPDAVARAITRVGLADRAKSKMKTLSGGMLRRAGIAQAIVNDPDILLLDEPTAGLDPEQRVDFRALLREIGTTSTVVVSTHLVEDVATACTQVTLLDGGRLVFEGTPSQLEDVGESALARGEVSGDSPLERGYTAALRHAREGAPA